MMHLSQTEIMKQKTMGPQWQDGQPVGCTFSPDSFTDSQTKLNKGMKFPSNN